MAPTTLPSFLTGMPPAKIMMRPSLDAWMPKNCPPDWACVARSFVAMSNARGGVGLLDRDVDAADPRVVHADVRDEIATGVGDGDVHGLADLGGLLLSGGDHSLGVSESKHVGSPIMTRAYVSTCDRGGDQHPVRPLATSPAHAGIRGWGAALVALLGRRRPHCRSRCLRHPPNRRASATWGQHPGRRTAPFRVQSFKLRAESGAIEPGV